MSVKQTLRRTLARRRAERHLKTLVKQAITATKEAENDQREEAGRILGQISAQATRLADETLRVDPAWKGADRTLKAAQAAADAEDACHRTGWRHPLADEGAVNLFRDPYPEHDLRNRIDFTRILLELARNSPDSLDRSTIVIAAITATIFAVSAMFTLIDPAITPEPSNSVQSALTPQTESHAAGWLVLDAASAGLWLLVAAYLAATGAGGRWKHVAAVAGATLLLQGLKLGAL